MEKLADIGVFGGSGFYNFLEDIQEVKMETPYGMPSDSLFIGKIGSHKVAFMPRHRRDHSILPHMINYRANVWAMKEVDGKLEPDKNFSFYAYMEEGKTYYILLTTFLDQPATYTYCIDYIAETHTILDNCAVGPYSYNEITGELFIPGAIDYVYADPTQEYVYNSPDGDINGDGNNDVPVSGTALGDGYYHYLNADGTLGSVIYLDGSRPTAYFNSSSLFNICKDAQKYDPEKRALYINGYDYTTDVQSLCFSADLYNKNDKKGMIAVNKEVYAILQAITRSEKYDGVEETEGNVKSWLMFCYYSKLLNKNNIL
jgi:hypothetical protein